MEALIQRNPEKRKVSLLPVATAEEALVMVNAWGIDSSRKSMQTNGVSLSLMQFSFNSFANKIV